MNYLSKFSNDRQISFFGFNFLEHAYTYFTSSKKQSRNLVALTHACNAILLNGTNIFFGHDSNLYNVATIWSTGYFLYDTYSMLRFEKLDIMRFAYLYHHMASIYIIHHNPTQYYGDQILFWGELSNIPSYFVYYYLHTKYKNENKIKMWSNIQKWIYAGIRLPVLGYIAVKSIQNSPTMGPVKAAIPVYLMGLIWTYKLFNAKN